MTGKNKFYMYGPQSTTGKKRIAYVFNHPIFLGGGEISFYELIKCLDKNKFDPLIIVPANGEIATKLSRQGMDVSICPFPPLKTMVFGLPLIAVVKLGRILNSKNIHAIHVNGSRACFYCGIAGRCLGTPVLWHVRETIQDKAVYDWFLSRLSTSIICVSKSVQIKRFTKFGRQIYNKIHVVYNGVDTIRFTRDLKQGGKIRRKFELGDNMLFGIVGNVIPRKGYAFFLKGLARAKAINPDLSVKALFFGRFIDSKYKNKLYRLVKDKHLTDDVIFMGYSENISANLSVFDVFVLPSQSEGFSRSLIEAMSTGLPVLATKISEIEEAVSPGKNAILVEYGDVSQMAAAITELAEDKKLREVLGRENRKRAQSVFSMRHHVDSIQRVYENLLMKTDKKNTYAHSI